MKNRPFFARVKKFLNYPFNWDFIDRHQRAMLHLEELKSSYYDRQNEKFDIENSIAYQEVVDLQNELNQCWDLHDVTLLLSKEVNSILWGKNNIKIQIFDLKTKWFLWDNIMLGASFIKQERARENAKRQLKVLSEISSIFDLGKYIPSE